MVIATYICELAE